MAEIHLKRKNIGELIKCYKQMVRINPNDPRLLVKLAGTYEIAKKYADAINCINKILEMGKTNDISLNYSSTYYVMGKLYQKAGEHDQATEHFELALIHGAKRQKDYCDSLRKLFTIYNAKANEFDSRYQAALVSALEDQPTDNKKVRNIEGIVKLHIISFQMKRDDYRNKAQGMQDKLDALTPSKEQKDNSVNLLLYARYPTFFKVQLSKGNSENGRRSQNNNHHNISNRNQGRQ